MVLVAIFLGVGKNTWGWTNAIIKWIVYICPLYRAGDFIIGLVAGYIFLTIKKHGGARISHTVAEIMCILLIIVQVIIYDSDVSRATNWLLTLFWLPVSVLCIYLFAENRGLISRVLSKSKALIWIGNISGDAFLIHQICIKAMASLIKNKWLVAVVAFVLTLIATVTWRWMYRIIQNRRRKTNSGGVQVTR